MWKADMHALFFREVKASTKKEKQANQTLETVYGSSSTCPMVRSHMHLQLPQHAHICAFRATHYGRHSKKHSSMCDLLLQ